MRMLFRTFNGYEKGKLSWSFGEEALIGAKVDDLGKQILYSEKTKYNPYCLSGGERYFSLKLSSSPDFKSLLKKCTEFAEDYFEVGCVTFCDEKLHRSRILVQEAQLNAYSGMEDMNTFYILFNARPSLQFDMKHSVKVGYDRYAIEREQGSVIVWDLDLIDGMDLGDHTFWGVRHGTGNKYSCTDDVMVGIKKGKELFVSY